MPHQKEMKLKNKRGYSKITREERLKLIELVEEESYPLKMAAI